MSQAVAELDGILASMLSLKPPGVTGSKINSISTLCTANIQSESVIVQKIYMHFQRAPATHKLGVLYVIDSVARQWVDQAKKADQTANPDAADGTFAAGVNRITELLPSLLNDIISVCPVDQRPKIKKLLEIWERSNTFPVDMLAPFKKSIDEPPKSTTPPFSPRPGFVPLGQNTAHQSPLAPSTTVNTAPKDTAAILEALKSLGAQQQQQNPGPQSSAPVSAPIGSLLGMPGSLPSSTPAPNPFAAFMGGTQSTMPASGLPSAAAAPNPFAAFLPPSTQTVLPPTPAPAVVPSVGVDTQQTIQLIQAMAAQGVPQDQWLAAIQIFNAQKAQNGTLPPPLPLPAVQGLSNGLASRDPYRPTQLPAGLNSNGRKRSRSPDRGDASYRRRSPPGHRQSPSLTSNTLPVSTPRNVGHDPTLPSGTIKVLSRTLFVGGVTTSSDQLKSLFQIHGPVQTCIVNTDKRHGFIKMVSRTAAEKARSAMEDYKDSNGQLRTKWGVGFGPRDCSDYQTGVSIIPMSRLTDADRKWLVSAEYGGTGGSPIVERMIVEEPDIEIGAGVSSKAMSRRIATDQGGNRGPKSSTSGRDDDSRDRRDNRRRGRDDRDNPNMMPVSADKVNGGTAMGSMASGMPGMAGMTFPFPMMPNGMPMLPPGMTFPFSMSGMMNGQNQGNGGQGGAEGE